MGGMQTFLLLLLLTFSSCAFKMGKVPVIVKSLETDEINYEDLMKKKESAKSSKEIKKDCMHIYLFVPDKLDLDMKTVLNHSCSKSNYSFNNEFTDRVFYFLYGQECFVNEYNCENI